MTTRARVADAAGRAARHALSAMGAVSGRRLDFAVIGAQKAGTTALWSFLRQHPQIYDRGRKELHAFDRDTYGRRPHPALAARLLRRPRGTVVGDVTPRTMFLPGAVERLAAHAPDARLVAILREPQARALSAWRMRRRRDKEQRTFSVAIRDELELGLRFDRRVHYLARGLYAPQLRHVLTLFDREQLLVLPHADLLERHEQTITAIVAHLGLPPFDRVPPQEIRHTSPGPIPTISDADRALMDLVFRDANAELAAEWGITFDDAGRA